MCGIESRQSIQRQPSPGTEIYSVSKVDWDQAQNKIQDLRRDIQNQRGELENIQREKLLPTAENDQTFIQHLEGLEIKTGGKDKARDRRTTYPGSAAPDLASFGGETKNSLFLGDKKVSRAFGGLCDPSMTR